MSSVRIGIYGSGRTAAELVAALPHTPFELTTAVVHSKHRAGQDIGELTVGEAIGVVATSDLEAAVDSSNLDVLLYAGLFGERHEHALQVCADAGVDMVHPCFVHPRVALDPGLVERLDAAADRSGARLVGTGVLPGLWLDVMPALLTSAVPAPVSIDARRISDISTWGKDVLIHELGVGTTLTGMAERYDMALRESAQMLCDVLHLDHPELLSGGGRVVAQADVSVGALDLKPGEVEGFEQHVVARANGLVRVKLSWLGLADPGSRGLDPGVAITLTAGDRTQIVVHLTPPRDPYPGTAARILSAILPLRTLRPGLHSTTALPVG